MTKARDIASATTPNANAALLATFPHKNLIINGAMQVAQRGTSETGITSGGSYRNAPDRFKFGLSSAGTWTVSQDSDAPEGFANSYKLACTTADASLSAGDYIDFLTGFEGQDVQRLKKGTASAESVTLSFWCKSNKTGTYIVNIQDTDNARTVAKSYTVNVAGTWEYKTLTFVGDTNGVLDDDNAQSLRVKWWFAAGSTYSSGTLATSWEANTAANYAVGQVNLADSTSNYFNITGIQLELGGTATPFEHRSFGDELARCQRYFQVHEDIQMRGYINASFTRIEQHVAWPVEMRANPTSAIITTGSSSNIRSPDTTYSGFRMNTSKNGAVLSMESASSGLMYFTGRKESLDAEL